MLYVFFVNCPSLTMMHLCITQCTYWTPICPFGTSSRRGFPASIATNIQPMLPTHPDSPVVFPPQLFYSKLKILFSNKSYPDSSSSPYLPPVSAPNVILHSRLPDSPDLDTLTVDFVLVEAPALPLSKLVPATTLFVGTVAIWSLRLKDGSDYD